ncbi:MAG TPA: tRNA (adenosine(37)-N6)-dimethylallyltransferase MiaA, partial [Candidatus Paceibacterota bacterium]|nr:tRNA (adenosine(37)-N6)-dimethylallyltransferase MiaA [Candidatus Paceibacterota bacterium]
MSEKPKIVVILGPTASGKTALSIKVAQKIGGEVISADSRQVYKGLDLGTGKVTKKEMGSVPHHLLDVASPKRKFSVARYQKLANKKITEIIKRGRTPIIVGGSGFYIQAIVDNLILPDVPPNPKLRLELQGKTIHELFSILKKIDPQRAKNIDENNPVRLIRAIEIGKALGQVPKLQFANPPFNFIQ